MPAAFEDISALDHPLQDNYWSVVSDLVSLIERTRANERTSGPAKQVAGANEFIEAGATQDGGSREIAANSAWNDCNQRLREALYFLLEARANCEPAACSNKGKQVAA